MQRLENTRKKKKKKVETNELEIAGFDEQGPEEVENNPVKFGGLANVLHKRFNDPVLASSEQ